MEYLMIILTIILMTMLFSSFRGRTLVLKQFVLKPDDADGNIVTIVARKSGFFAWLLTHLFKISPETSLLVTTKDCCFRKKGIASEDNVLVTLKQGISNICCKYQKPVWLLVLSIVVLLGGIIGASIAGEEGNSELIAPTFIGNLVFSIILFLVFYFKKSIAIVINTTSGAKYGIKFKPSFIEGEDVNLEKAKELVSVIQNQILKEQA